MNTAEQIRIASKQAIENLYSISLTDNQIQINETNPEFEGDYTLVLFSFIKQLKKSPEQLGNEIGEYLLKYNSSFFSSYNIIKGFLNLTLNDSYWINFLQANYSIFLAGVFQKY
jgi:arginyl-tRNA synthetase